MATDETDQVQCAQCLCTLYWTNAGDGGVTGEICGTCQQEEDDWYDTMMDDD